MVCLKNLVSILRELWANLLNYFYAKVHVVDTQCARDVKKKYGFIKKKQVDFGMLRELILTIQRLMLEFWTLFKHILNVIRLESLGL